MPRTFGQNSEEINAAALPVIGVAASTTDDLIIAAINAHLDQPFRLSATQPVADAKLNITAFEVTLGDLAGKVSSPVGVNVPTTVATTINFQTGAITGGTVNYNGVTLVLPTSALAGNFRRMVFAVQQDSSISVNFGAEFASYASLENAASLLLAIGGTPVGYIDLQSTSTSTPGQYKTAGSTTSIIENSTTISATTAPRIHRFGAGAGGGGGAGTDFKVQSIAANVATMGAGFIMLEDGRELVTYDGSTLGATLTFNLKTGVNNTGVIAPGATQNGYYLYIDLAALPASQTMSNGRVVFPVQSGTSGPFIIFQTAPNSGSINLARYVPIAELATDGSSNYLFSVNGDIARRTHDNLAVWSDQSFNIASVIGNIALIKGGQLVLDDGRELMTYDGVTNGADVSMNLKTETNSAGVTAPGATQTGYYLYLDVNQLPSATTLANGRSIVQVQKGTSGPFVVLQSIPNVTAQNRYVPIACLSTDGSSNYTYAANVNLARRRYNRPSVAMSPVTLTPAAQATVGSIGSVGQIRAGHILTLGKSFPATIGATQYSFYNLSANANDGNPSNAKNLTNTGSTSFTANNIFGIASAASFNGTSQFLSSSDAFFNPGHVNFAFGGWFNATQWTSATTFGNGTNTQTLVGRYVSGNDAYLLQLNASLRSLVVYTGNGNSLVISTPSSWTNGSWHHIAVIYNSTNDIYSVYFDGKPYTSSSPSAKSTGAAGSFEIGGILGAATDLFTGSAQDVFFVNGFSLTEDDIHKLYSYRLGHNKAVNVDNQRWSGTLYTETAAFKQEMTPRDFIVETETNDVFWDLTDAGTTEQVTIKLQDLGLSPVSIPTKDYDSGLLSVTPTFPLAHGLGDLPKAVWLLQEVNATPGKFTVLDVGSFLQWDSTNFYAVDAAAWTALAIDSTHRIRISTSVDSRGIGAAPTDGISAGIVSTTSQVFEGEKILNKGLITADTSTGGATIPAGDTLTHPTLNIGANTYNINGTFAPIGLVTGTGTIQGTGTVQEEVLTPDTPQVITGAKEFTVPVSTDAGVVSQDLVSQNITVAPGQTLFQPNMNIGSAFTLTVNGSVYAPANFTAAGNVVGVGNVFSL